MHETVIEARRPRGEYVKDLLRHKELFYFFAWRDIVVRYKQAFFGVAWALFRPLITMALFTLIFSKLANFPSGGIPYPLFALSGMIPWMLFANVLTETTVSLLNNPSLLQRVYFPRMVLPASQILVQLVDFIVALLLLFLFILLWGNISFFTFVFFPFFVTLLLLLCLGAGLILSALTVRFRDVRYIVPFFVQFGIYLSPVGYGSFMIPERWQWLYFLNPMAGIIEGFRWSLFGFTPPYLVEAVGFSCAITALVLGVGYVYFRAAERHFGDLL